MGVTSRAGPRPDRASPADLDGVPPSQDPSWMHALSRHYLSARRDAPHDRLCIVFDIDGTILDMRHLVVHVLLTYDRRHGTDHFRGLVADEIDHHESDVDGILDSLSVPAGLRRDIGSFYREHLWSREALLAASRPFEGVFGVIRWFQLQPFTHVALNTGRPEAMRQDTMESLNALAAVYRVRFEPDLLFMAQGLGDIPGAKVRALRQLAGSGYRVVAVVDNEPENLRAMAADETSVDALFLHADTIFGSQREHNDRVVSGTGYALSELVPERSLPERVAFVWHGVNDEVNLQRFLASDVSWAEVDVRRDPIGRLVLRHDGYEETPWDRGEPVLFAADAMSRLAREGRSVKLDLKEGGATAIDALEIVDAVGLDDGQVWFNSELQSLGQDGFEWLRERHPEATISCPVDPLLPLMLASETGAERVLGLVRGWGVTRLSVRWGPLARRLLDDLEGRGWQVNLYAIPDLEAFLEASLLLPTSVTADFNFPGWGYHGLGSGAGGRGRGDS